MLKQLFRQLLARGRDRAPAVGANVAALIARSQEAVARGDLAGAETLLRDAVRLSPTAIVYAFLGELLQSSGRTAEAAGCYERALGSDPARVELRLNYAACLKEMRNYDAAGREYRRLIAERPEWALSYASYGALAIEQANWQEALVVLRRALALQPDLVEAHVNLSVALQQTGQLAEALRHCKAALEIDPGYVPALTNLAGEQQQLGDAEAARATLRMRIAASPADDGAAIAMALALPSILDSREHIERVRQRLTEDLDALLSRKLTVRDPPREIGVMPFYLAYHGRDDRELHQKIAAVHLHACPSLAYVAPHCAPPRQTSDRIRVGIVSRFLYSHSIGRVTRGLFRHLDRRRFSVHAFSLREPFDDISWEIAEQADKWITLPQDLVEARLAIAAAQLDVLLYPDIGMDPHTYYLTFARLAPVQCATWGHPVTSGVPNIDYFLSTDYFETADADAHYSEKLVRLQDVAFPGHYSRPDPLLDVPASEGSQGKRRQYLCPQALFKFHPDFDVLLKDLLREDRSGEVAIVGEPEADHFRMIALQPRLRRTLGDAYKRVIFLPRAPTGAGYLQRLQACDVVLDTIHYSGGNTSLEAISVGALVVTMPSQFNRGRHTYGFLRKMRFTETVVSTPEQYVELAIRIATDHGFRAELKSSQALAAAALYEDASAVEQIESFFETALRDALAT